MNGSRLDETVVFHSIPDSSTPRSLAMIFAISMSKPSYLLPVCRPRPGWSPLTPMTSFLSFLALPATPVSVVPPLLPPPPPVPPPHAPVNPSASARPVSTASALRSRIASPSTVDIRRAGTAQCVSTFDRKSLARSLRGLLKNSAGTACSTSCPPSMKITRLAACRAKPISWVTTTMVMPSRARPVITSSTSPTISGSSALVGSSNSIALGCMASARAIAARCCWPPESWAGYLAAWSAMPTRCNRAMPRSRAAAGFSRRTLIGPSVTFCRMVLWANRLNDWKTMPTSLRSRASGRPSAGSGAPSKWIVPESMGSSRLMLRHRVDLPDPEGPITTTTSPRSTVRSTSRKTCSDPNHLLTPSSMMSGSLDWPVISVIPPVRDHERVTTPPVAGVAWRSWTLVPPPGGAGVQDLVPSYRGGHGTRDRLHVRRAGVEVRPRRMRRDRLRPQPVRRAPGPGRHRSRSGRDRCPGAGRRSHPGVRHRRPRLRRGARGAHRREPARRRRRGARGRAVGCVRRGRRRLQHRHGQGGQPAAHQPRRADGLRQPAGRCRARPGAPAQATGRRAHHDRYRRRAHATRAARTVLRRQPDLRSVGGAGDAAAGHVVSAGGAARRRRGGPRRHGPRRDLRRPGLRQRRRAPPARQRLPHRRAGARLPAPGLPRRRTAGTARDGGVADRTGGVAVHLPRRPRPARARRPAARAGPGAAGRPGRVPAVGARRADARHRHAERHRRRRIRYGGHRRTGRGHDETAAAAGHRAAPGHRGRRGRHLRPLDRPVVTPLPELVSALRTAGVGAVSAGTAERAAYAADASLYRVVPAAVAWPRDADEVAAALAACRTLGVPVTCRGAGTSIAGNAVGTGLVLDFSRYLNRILDLDPQARTATVQPGVVHATLQRAAAAHGLRFGPDPSTHTRCTIGGMIGNNACGSRSLAYGRTSDNVLGLEVLTGAGQPLRLTGPDPAGHDELRRIAGSALATIRTEFGRFPRQVSGYALEALLPEHRFDLRRLFVGSEGTLGVVTAATVHLVADPAHRILADAAPLDGQVVTDPAQAAALWRIREDGAGLAGRTPAGEPAYPGWEDSAVPPESLGAYLRELDALLDGYRLTGIPYGHFGEGCLHLRLNFPLHRPDGTATMRAFLTDAARLVARYGGALSGEHGDGRARGELLPLLYSPAALDLFGQVKAVFDAEDRLNPGVLVRPRPLDADVRGGGPPVRARLALAYRHDGGDFTAAVHRCTGVARCR